MAKAGDACVACGIVDESKFGTNTAGGRQATCKDCLLKKQSSVFSNPNTRPAVILPIDPRDKNKQGNK